MTVPETEIMIDYTNCCISVLPGDPVTTAPELIQIQDSVYDWKIEASYLFYY